MIFNIIFTPGTVKYFRLFVLSLLRHSDLDFRLVSNGCATDEFHLLRDFAEANGRLSVTALPGQKMVEHFEALNHLHARYPDDDPFCFIDSDIRATGDFMSDLDHFSELRQATFSALPLWVEDPVWRPGLKMQGRYTRASDGSCLGSSYFAIYNRPALDSFMSKSGIDFSRYKWENLPKDIQQNLNDAAMSAKKHDTAKVLNVLFQQEGNTVEYRGSAHLLHVGGLSWIISKAQLLAPLLPKGGLPPQVELAAKIQTRKDFDSSWRRLVSEYIGKVLFSIIDDDDYPILPPIDDHKVLEQLELIGAELLSLKVEYYSELDCSSLNVS